MKKWILANALIMLCTINLAHADNTAEKLLLQRWHDSWISAWNAHHPEQMAAFWAVDGDLIDPFGRHPEGSSAVEKLFEEEHSEKGLMAGTTYSGSIENIRFLGTDIAIIDVAAEITGMLDANGNTAPDLKHHVTWVVEKKKDAWKAVAVRPCAPVDHP
jgi:uncharacterized protein (TIGR02246 family)